MITTAVAEGHAILASCRNRGWGRPGSLHVRWFIDGTEKRWPVGRHIVLGNAGVLQFSQFGLEMMDVAFGRAMTRASL